MSQTLPRPTSLPNPEHSLHESRTLTHIEESNGLIRQYFPKGTNLNLHSPERLAEVAAKINARPRESRNWEPAQLHFDRLKETAPI